MIEPGTLLQGRFLIEEKIGMGGMGAVYRAVDQKFGSVVAIKETFYGDTELAEAFEREARLLNGLHHPILPHVSDYFTENGGHFLVMEFIEGEDLSELLKRGEKFSVSVVVGWTLDILDGLDYLHSKNPPVVHRDIKPNNLKLTSRGKIVLLDFGMAKETSATNTLGAKSVFGYSRKYSPLEQMEGTGTDARSDIFSLGASVYHLLTGEPPVDVLARASAIVAGRPDPLTPANVLNTDVPESVAAILHSSLALNADNRFESAGAMSSALEHVINTSLISHHATEDRAADHARIEDRGIVMGSAASYAANGVDRAHSPGEQMDAGNVDDGPEPVSSQSNATSDEEGAVTWVPVISEPQAIPADNYIDRTHRSRDLRQKIGAAFPVTSVLPLRIRRPARLGYALGVPALLLCLALVLFGTYRGITTVDDVSNDSTEPVTTEHSADALPESSDLQMSEAGLPDEQAAPVQAEDNAINLRKGPIVVRPESTRRTAGEAKQEIRAAAEAQPARPVDRRAENQRAAGESRPRKVVRPAFEQPSISSIEAIMTGVPYESRRAPVGDDREWSEDELRRRRLRQMRREQRRQQQQPN